MFGEPWVNHGRKGWIWFMFSDINQLIEHIKLDSKVAAQMIENTRT